MVKPSSIFSYPCTLSRPEAALKKRNVFFKENHDFFLISSFLLSSRDLTLAVMPEAKPSS